MDVLISIISAQICSLFLFEVLVDVVLDVQNAPVVRLSLRHLLVALVEISEVVNLDFWVNFMLGTEI